MVLSLEREGMLVPRVLDTKISNITLSLHLLVRSWSQSGGTSRLKYMHGNCELSLGDTGPFVLSMRLSSW